MAGLEVARELARQGVPSLLLEWGSSGDRRHYRATLDEREALDWWLEPEHDPCFRRPWSTTGSAFAGLAGLRCRVGGRSLYWHGVTLPIEPWALQSGVWPGPVCRDLTESWDGGPSLYDRVVADLAAWVDPSRPDGLEHPGRIVVGDHVLRTTPQAVRGCPDGRWEAFSPLAEWPAPGSPAAPRLVPDCRALGVLVDAGRVTGVRVRHGGVVSDIRVGRVVLAAGTIENSRLAIQALTDAGALPEPRLTGLTDKISYGFSVTVEPARLEPDLAAAVRDGGFFVASCPPELRSNLFATVRTASVGVGVLDIWLMGEQTPGEAGVVRCDPEPAWPWPVTVDSGLGPEDRRLADAQQAELQRIWQLLRCSVPGAHPELVFDDFGSLDLPDRLRGSGRPARPGAPLTYSFPLGSELHEASTTPLGGMLDDSHAFHEVAGLFASGPGSFPRTGAANPGLTVLALARRLARRLAAS